jgi:hypothetical protein
MGRFTPEGPGEPDRPVLHGAAIRAGTQRQERHTELGAMLATGEGQQKPPSAPPSVNHHLTAPHTKLRTRIPLDGSAPDGPTDDEDRD